MRLSLIVPAMLLAASLLGACEYINDPTGITSVVIKDIPAIGVSPEGSNLPGDTIVVWVWGTTPADTIEWRVLGDCYRMLDADISGRAAASPRDTARIVAVKPGTGSVVAGFRGRSVAYSRPLITRRPGSS